MSDSVLLSTAGWWCWQRWWYPR
ncbi:hypothetical protein Hamer_G022617 [Homarus americanus]|uniref:Uncharacterized protein n=1 Tax=Homarus americanus TaxID=6706 RepID=A0A8J5MTH5_HOMAM|nr:hypothetical protein Hamer_G022617 [Homarus americanus]